MSNNEENDANDELATLLVEELPIFQKEIMEAIQSKNIAELQHHSHQLYGVCCYLSVPKLKNLAKTLELQASTLTNDEISTLTQQIDQEINQFINKLKDHS